MVEERTLVSGVIVDERVEYTLQQLCTLCGISAERAIEMIAEGVIEPDGRGPQWQFSGRAVWRMKKALRLERDLGVNLAGAALALDLLEELEGLRRLAQQLMRDR